MLKFVFLPGYGCPEPRIQTKQDIWVPGSAGSISHFLRQQDKFYNTWKKQNRS